MAFDKLRASLMAPLVLGYPDFKLHKGELLALKWAITEKFRDLLMYANFTVVTLGQWERGREGGTTEPAGEKQKCIDLLYH